jgi:4'-phosphopantetheinyl transferase
MLDCELGVDIELVRPIPDWRHIATHYFSTDETREIAHLEPHLRERAFFQCWTRKEAYLKAIGDGLTVPLNSFRVSLMRETPLALVHFTNNTSQIDLWNLHNLEPGPDHVGAVAYSGDLCVLRASNVLLLNELFDCVIV